VSIDNKRDFRCHDLLIIDNYCVRHKQICLLRADWAAGSNTNQVSILAKADRIFN
jgi:hypothetical protein